MTHNPYAEELARYARRGDAPVRCSADEERAFRRAVAEMPHHHADALPLLVFADWLDEHGRPDEALGYRRAGDLMQRGQTFPAWNEPPGAVPIPRGGDRVLRVRDARPRIRDRFVVVTRPEASPDVGKQLRDSQRQFGEGHGYPLPSVFVAGTPEGLRRNHGIRVTGSIDGHLFADWHHLARSLMTEPPPGRDYLHGAT